MKQDLQLVFTVFSKISP